MSSNADSHPVLIIRIISCSPAAPWVQLVLPLWMQLLLLSLFQRLSAWYPREDSEPSQHRKVTFNIISLVFYFNFILPQMDSLKSVTVLFFIVYLYKRIEERRNWSADQSKWTDWKVFVNWVSWRIEKLSYVCRKRFSWYKHNCEHPYERSSCEYQLYFDIVNGTKCRHTLRRKVHRWYMYCLNLCNII